MIPERSGRLPELLAPAGSPDALRAAVDAGADAVYFGAQSFNARQNADNFTPEELSEAIRYCRIFGVKTNIVLNTQLYTRELKEALKTAERLIILGADAFIVADIGFAALLHRYFPDFPLHASTQMSGQNVYSAKMLAELGFSRMVAPRELSLRDIKFLCEESPIETEIFVHGALCVSHSGQCLMSSVIGGRSGNRGECAQPCRLPYRTKNPYALSLKDLCLAAHIPAILDTGIASLKIEGRMKSPDYVYGVVSGYRKLLDGRRSADGQEMDRLAGLFSRSGFTDGYFTERVSADMLGIRTDDDKKRTANEEGRSLAGRRLDLQLTASFLAGHPAVLTGTVSRGAESICATVEGATCAPADRTPTDKERLTACLSKLGDTVFAAKSVCVETDGVYMPVSQVNALRRELCRELTEKLAGAPAAVMPCAYDGPEKKYPPQSDEKSAYFAYAETITPHALDYFDRIFLPLAEYVKYVNEGAADLKVGLAFPPVCFDHEMDIVRTMARTAKDAGCRTALISGLWQAVLADEMGFEKHGDLRLNLFNAESAAVYERLGFHSLLLSVEVNTSALPVFSSGIALGYVAYGRLPLMTLEKCAIRDGLPSDPDRKQCRYCETHHFTPLTDRTGARFLLCREFSHRNVLYNSVPVYMADKPVRGFFRHCIFTDESRRAVDEVIGRLARETPPTGKFKRI